MSNVTPFPKLDDNAEIFGGCPKCLCLANIWNVGKCHWAVCHRHKTKWHIGANLFSSWRYETEADWLANSYRLAEYREVKPLWPRDLGPGGDRW